MSWTLHPAGEAFERHRPAWDALNRANGNHILLDGGFVSILLRHFGHPDVRLAPRTRPARASPWSSGDAEASGGRSSPRRPRSGWSSWDRVRTSGVRSID
jgi:hypothetical protein